MNRRELGGAQVSAVGLGAMPLAIAGRPPEPDAIRVVHAALDAGMNWIDTADAYCLDSSDAGYGERLVARALREWTGPRDDVRVATKGGIVRPGGEWRPNGRPEHLKAACDASLRNLGVSSIFLYQLHCPDRSVYFPDSVGAIAELKKQGKVQHVGLSNVDVALIRQARGVVEIAGVQNRCNVFDRGSLSDGVVSLCERERIAFIAHSPVGGHRGHARASSDPTLAAVAARHGVTPYEVALAWLLDRSASVLVIPGASRAESARSSAAAADVVLRDADREELDRAFPEPSRLTRQLALAKREAKHLFRSVRARAHRRLTRSRS
jgi:aryl-alcohol dehydrogenase-like predicted oxidoreductase